MKRILAVLILCVAAFGQANNAHMLTGVNVQTGTTYPFVAQDATRLTRFSNASSIAATMASPLTQGFGAGHLFSVQNIGVGTVTITCSSCVFFASGAVGSATFTLTTGQGADIYSDGSNYTVQTGAGSGGGGGCTGSCVNNVFGRAGPTVTANAADYGTVGITAPSGGTLNIAVQNNGELDMGNGLNFMSFFPGPSHLGIIMEDLASDILGMGQLGSGNFGIELVVNSNLGNGPTFQMDTGGTFTYTPDGATTVETLSGSGMAVNVPLFANAGCTGCGNLSLGANQFIIGAGSSSTVNATAPQGALAYDTVANGGPDLRAMADTDIAQGVTGTTASPFVLADQPQFTTNASTPKLTLNGTGPTEWDFTYQATPNAPTANFSKMAMFVNNYLEFSENGFAYTSPVVVMQTAADFPTSSTTPVPITGLTSPTINAGQTVQFQCTGLYQFATGVTKMLSRVVATQGPQKMWYWVQTDSNSTGGASQRQTATANNTTITPGGNVNAIATYYGFGIGGYIQWNASTPGTFTIQVGTNTGADQLTIAQGAFCTVTVQ